MIKIDEISIQMEYDNEKNYEQKRCLFGSNQSLISFPSVFTFFFQKFLLTAILAACLLELNKFFIQPLPFDDREIEMLICSAMEHNSWPPSVRVTIDYSSSS